MEEEESEEKPFDPCSTIPVSQTEFEEWCKSWKNALVVKEEDYTHALMERPWMVTGHYLIIQRWRPFFLTTEEAVKKIAAWIRIPNLHIELYNHRFLCRISVLGCNLNIEYEVLHQICFTCGVYSHRLEFCGEGLAANGDNREGTGNQEGQNNFGTEDFGDGNDPTKNSQNLGKNQGQDYSKYGYEKNQDDEDMSNGLRFSILHEDSEADSKVHEEI
ncbi:hypothetical protein Ahy_A04g021568 [Arachis hypogaea]|uniref:Uncharacterized protein n=1 Tax=Arachis hypogaea TaxID=3818 RepID=A0A445DKU3_ARAHY|nr:hypothetical protein Ahy_A04g021568 [Arachis hypogaea]